MNIEITPEEKFAIKDLITQVSNNNNSVGSDDYFVEVSQFSITRENFNLLRKILFDFSKQEPCPDWLKKVAQ
jgi:hypothetical protein